MYQEYYHLTCKPFSLVPNPDFLYNTKKHAIALSLLEFSLYDETGISLITGEIGSGKTTLVRKVLEDVQDNLSIGVITNTHKNFGDLLNWILRAYDLESRGNKAADYEILVDFIASESAKNRRVVLIVDEAQNMSVETLEELRLLSNINMGDHLLWQLILIGQPELKDTLMRPELMQFSQRISLEFHIPALKYKETVDYIKHRLKVAGTEKNLFEPVAYAIIYYHSRGIPRIINTICDLALVYGFANNAKTISPQAIMQVLKDRQVSLYQLSQKAIPDDAAKLRSAILSKAGFDIADIKEYTNI